MDQYHPAYHAHLLTKLNRPVKRDEVVEAVELAHQAGLYRLDQRVAC